MAAVSLSDLAGQHVYLDANIFIYALERHPDYLARLDQLFAHIDAGDNTASTSEITLAECLVKPFADNNLDRQQLYQAAIASRRNFDVVPVSRAVIVHAARLRALHKPRLPDAIHLATALAAGCQTLLTNDNLIKPIAGIQVVQLSELTG
jgi:predicted nucleic acid-binding protein